MKNFSRRKFFRVFSHTTLLGMTAPTLLASPWTTAQPVGTKPGSRSGRTNRQEPLTNSGINSGFNGPLRYNPVNPRYFTDNSGKSVYLTGSHTWAVMQDMWLETQARKNMDYGGFIRMMQGNGHNFLRFWQWNHLKNAQWNEVSTVFDPLPNVRTGPGKARDGLPKFDLTQWDDAYFQRLRDRVEQAASKGIYVSIMFFDGWAHRLAKKPETNPWPYNPLHPDNNINQITGDPTTPDGRAMGLFTLKFPQFLRWQEEFIKKTVDTVNDLDNVLYEIINEMRSTPEHMEWQNHLCDFIKNYEQGLPKQHPVGITAQGGDQNNEIMFDTAADWISPGNGNTYEYRYNPPAADGSKVILADTDHLWGHGGEVSWVWKSFTRGLNPIFMDPWEPIPADVSDRPWWMDDGVPLNSRYYYKWDPIRRNLGYAGNFALRMDLNQCVPHGELCSSMYCLANPGYEYLCYLPEGGEAGLDLNGKEGKFEMEWFSPHTGKTVVGKNVEGGKGIVLSPPMKGYDVVYLHKLTP